VEKRKNYRRRRKRRMNIRGENRVDGLRIFEDSIARKFQDNKIFPGFNLNYVCRYFFELR
jgi:hypothetical protein